MLRRIATFARTAPLLLIAVITAACGAPNDDDASVEQGAALSDPPSGWWPGFTESLAWQSWLMENYPAAYTTSSPADADPRPWGGGFDPARDPVFATNAIDIPGVTVDDAFELLSSGRSDTYYPNSGPASECRLVGVGEPVRLTLGLDYCWVTFGAKQHMRVVEVEDSGDERILAWQGGSAGIEVYHRWMIRPTATGVRVITEECERGLLAGRDFYASRMNPSLHAGHEAWLVGMRDRLTGGRP